MGSDSMRKIKGYGIGERAVIGKLKKLGGSRSHGEIVICERELDAADISALPDDISGVVAVGEPTDAVAVALRAAGISALFIDYEMAQGLCGGERAVMYPERNTLFIAPKIEIVEDFYTRFRKEMESEPREGRCIDCRELTSGKVAKRVLVAETDNIGEEAAFEFYKKAAEECELNTLVLIFDVSRFKDTECLRKAIKGSIRAAIYTKIVFAVSVNGILECERVYQLIKGTLKELGERGGEIPEDVSFGVLIKDASEVVCIEEYSRAAELILIDSTALVCGASESDRDRVLAGYLRVIEERASGSVRDIIFIGDKQLVEKCAQGILRGRVESERSYFWTDAKNMK